MWINTWCTDWSGVLDCFPNSNRKCSLYRLQWFSFWCSVVIFNQVENYWWVHIWNIIQLTWICVSVLMLYCYCLQCIISVIVCTIVYSLYSSTPRFARTRHCVAFIEIHETDYRLNRNTLKETKHQYMFCADTMTFKANYPHNQYSAVLMMGSIMWWRIWKFLIMLKNQKLAPVLKFKWKCKILVPFIRKREHTFCKTEQHKNSSLIFNRKKEIDDARSLITAI